MSKLLQYGAKLVNKQSVHLNGKYLLANRSVSTSSRVDQESSINFLNGSSTTYIEEMYQAWKADPKSVHKSWDVYFRTNSVSNPPPTLGEIPAQDVGSADLSKMLQLLNNLPQLSSQSGNVCQSKSFGGS